MPLPHPNLRIATKMLLTAALALLAACSGKPLPIPPEPSTSISAPQYATRIERARATVSSLLEDYPAVSISVGINGQLVWSEALGWADVSELRPARPDTRFRMYSDSKPLTAVLALRLSESGALNLDSGIGDFMPDLPEALRAITPRQLLQHSSGIRHYRKGEWMTVSKRPCASPHDALLPFIHDPLLHTPEETFAYSSYGYVLLSAAIEAATQEPFHELMQREVLSVSGMSHTGREVPGDQRLATAYDQTGTGRVSVSETVDNSCKFGAGALVGTSEDLALFGMALTEGKLLSAKARDEMLVASKQSMQAGRQYGLGWGLATDPKLGRVAGHSGGGLGGRAYLLMVPEHRLVVAMLGNTEGASMETIALEVAAEFVDQDR